MTAREFVRQGNLTALRPAEVLRYLEAEMIQVQLEAHGGNICAVAREWGVHRNTLTRKIHELADLGIITRVVKEPPKRRYYPRRDWAMGRTKAERLARIGREIKRPV